MGRGKRVFSCCDLTKDGSPVREVSEKNQGILSRSKTVNGFPTDSNTSRKLRGAGLEEKIHKQEQARTQG